MFEDSQIVDCLQYTIVVCLFLSLTFQKQWRVALVRPPLNATPEVNSPASLAESFHA